MEIQRTANAGVELTLDGIRILLDGLCDGAYGYLATPREMADKLISDPPHIVAFTHNHSDHFSEALVSEYRKQDLRPVLGPESLYSPQIRVGGVKITGVPSKHIGRTQPELKHFSYIIEGSRCVWFVGDATPSQWRGREDLPKPDVLIAPYAYANTASSWAATCKMAEHLVLLHLPQRDKDAFGLWKQVNDTVQGGGSTRVWIPEIGEIISIK